MDMIEEGGSSTNRGEQSEDSNEDENENEISTINNKNIPTVNQTVQEQKPENIRRSRPAPLEVLNYVTMNKTVETPRSTIKEVLKVPQQTELTFNRQNLKKVEAQLKRAFVEFYQKLRLLKSFG